MVNYEFCPHPPQAVPPRQRGTVNLSPFLPPEKDEKHRRQYFNVELYFVSLWREYPKGEGGLSLMRMSKHNSQLIIHNL